MTRTAGIYATQIVLGLIAIAAGYAMMRGAGHMVRHAHAIGIGQGFLLVSGAAEIVAGLSLLMPCGGFLGSLVPTSARS
jgi:hypothetical protein